MDLQLILVTHDQALISAFLCSYNFGYFANHWESDSSFSATGVCLNNR